MIRVRLLGLAVAVALSLAGCRADCPSCDSLGAGPAVESFAFRLCVSEAPVFADAAECGEVTVEFVEPLAD